MKALNNVPMTTAEIIDEVGFIRDGVNATYMINTARDTMNEEDYNEAVEWIYRKLGEDINVLVQRLYAMNRKAAQ